MSVATILLEIALQQALFYRQRRGQSQRSLRWGFQEAGTLQLRDLLPWVECVRSYCREPRNRPPMIGDEPIDARFEILYQPAQAGSCVPKPDPSIPNHVKSVHLQKVYLDDLWATKSNLGPYQRPRAIMLLRI